MGILFGQRFAYFDVFYDRRNHPMEKTIPNVVNKFKATGSLNNCNNWW